MISPESPFQSMFDRLWKALNILTPVFFYPSAFLSFLGVVFVSNAFIALPFILLAISTGAYLIWQWIDREFLIESGQNPQDWLTNQQVTERLIKLLKSRRIPVKVVESFRQRFYRAVPMLTNNLGEQAVRFEFVEVIQICFMREFQLSFEDSRARASKEFEAFARGQYPNP